MISPARARRVLGKMRGARETFHNVGVAVHLLQVVPPLLHLTQIRRLGVRNKGDWSRGFQEELGKIYLDFLSLSFPFLM